MRAHVFSYGIRFVCKKHDATEIQRAQVFVWSKPVLLRNIYIFCCIRFIDIL